MVCGLIAESEHGLIVFTGAPNYYKGPCRAKTEIPAELSQPQSLATAGKSLASGKETINLSSPSVHIILNNTNVITVNSIILARYVLIINARFSKSVLCCSQVFRRARYALITNARFSETKSASFLRSCQSPPCSRPSQ